MPTSLPQGLVPTRHDRPLSLDPEPVEIASPYSGRGPESVSLHKHVITNTNSERRRLTAGGNTRRLDILHARKVVILRAANSTHNGFESFPA